VTFDSFVPTDGTIETVELCHAMARSEPSAPRVLLVCGPPGSGKTHLLRAIGDVVSRERPSIPVVQTTADEVLQRWIAAIMLNEELDRPWPRAAFVTIDDLHTLAGRVLAQREFARQITLALDHDIRFACTIGRLSEAPALIQAIRRVPQSRVVRLRPPARTAMSRILAELTRGEAVALQARQLESIAAACRGDVRRAYGAIARERLLACAGG